MPAAGATAGILAMLALMALGAGCGKSKPLTAVDRGRIVYMSKCVECHNRDPNRNGSTGPAIADSSRELLEARVLHLKYPPGYKPKRDSNSMRAFPELAPRIDDLAAFLTSVRQKKR